MRAGRSIKSEALSNIATEVVDDLSDSLDEVKVTSNGALESGSIPIVTRGEMPNEWQVPYPVLCIASRSALDEGACAMLAQLLYKHGIAAWIQPFADLAGAKDFKVDTIDAPLVCISYFGSSSKPAHVRYVIRRLRRLMPRAKFVACFWLLGEDTTKKEE